MKKSLIAVVVSVIIVVAVFSSNTEAQHHPKAQRSSCAVLTCEGSDTPRGFELYSWNMAGIDLPLQRGMPMATVIAIAIDAGMEPTIFPGLTYYFIRR